MTVDTESKLVSETIQDIVAIVDAGTQALRSKERSARADEWPLHAARFMVSASVVVACGMIAFRSLSDLRGAIRRSRSAPSISARVDLELEQAS